MLATMVALCVSAGLTAQPPAPLQPIPSPRQMAWHRLETYVFTHFGPNTFTDVEWGGGNEDPNLFNPTALDCRQWVRAFKAAGMHMVIVTAKHHDGFCLWPSKFSTHTVAQSAWRDGKGDVLRELSEACREYGLKLGVYLSPWDRNHPSYGTPEYNKVFSNMLREVLTRYGPVHEVWFDGACGEGPNGKRQVYDWKLFIETVRKYQPDACIFSDGGPDIRWVGNEDGYAGETNWAPLNKEQFSPGAADTKQLFEGHADGSSWVPAECDVSIRPGWFYHADQDSKVKTLDKLMDIYEGSVGRNGNLLLNVPPDRRGRIHDNDVKALIAFKKERDRVYGRNLAKGATATASSERGPGFEPAKTLDGDQNTYYAAPDGTTACMLEFRCKRPVVFDRVLLQEFIPLGQRVSQFAIEAEVGGQWQQIAHGTTIGSKRIVRVPLTASKAVRLQITQSRACPTIATFSLHSTQGSQGAR